VVHVVYQFRPEGVPRLAFSLADVAHSLQGVQPVFVALCNTDTTLLSEAQKRGPVEWVLWSGRNYFSLFKGMLKVLRTHKPQGVVCYTLGAHVAVALACFLKRVPCVVHVGNTPPKSFWPRFKLMVQMHAGAPFVSAYIACSAYVQQQCVRAYHLPKRLWRTVINGVCVQKWASLRMPKNPVQNGWTLGMVGSLETHKDHMTFLKALHILVLQGHPVRALCVGDGSQRAFLHKQAQEMGVFEHVEWAGAVHDVKPFLQKMDVFVYSVTDDEGWGIALVEALCAGLPVAASNVGACAEVLQNGTHGVLCTPSNPQALAHAVLQARMRGPVSADACAVFDVQKTWQAYASYLGFQPADVLE
jgi:glycosyltransferase involved in cell wall biosynthesis